MLLKNLKKRKERLEKEKLKPKFIRTFMWKERYEQLKEETERRIRLYDITIKSLMEKLRKYEPSVEGLDN